MDHGLMYSEETHFRSSQNKVYNNGYKKLALVNLLYISSEITSKQTILRVVPIFEKP